MWTEGTAQAALYFKLAGNQAAAGKYEDAVRGMRQKDGSYLASNTAALPTGFMLESDPTQPRQYFRIPASGGRVLGGAGGAGLQPFHARGIASALNSSDKSRERA